MVLTPQPDGTYRANGEKYYIGNGNEAAMVSTFGKVEGTKDYVPCRDGETCVEMDTDGVPPRAFA
jgi:acyl-CoA dehydrogenase